jgi:hypothetical protein
VNFPLTVLDDALLDGSQPVTVTAQVKNWTPGSATVIARDNEPAVIEVTLPAETSEASGLLSGAGHIRLGGATVTNRVVTLLSSDEPVGRSGLLPYRWRVGRRSTTIVDDARFDGRRGVTAWAEGPCHGGRLSSSMDNGCADLF